MNLFLIKVLYRLQLSNEANILNGSLRATFVLISPTTQQSKYIKHQLKKIVMTLKLYLAISQVNITDEERSKLGLRIGRRWYTLYHNNTEKIKEELCMVNDYPPSFLQSNGVTRIISRFIKQL